MLKLSHFHPSLCPIRTWGLVYLILGWLFGLLSPSIIDRINQSYSIKQLLNGIKTEMKECQFRAVLIAYLLGIRYGKYDRDFLMWCRLYISKYQGLEPTEKYIDAIDYLVKMKDEDLKNRLDTKRSLEKRRGLNLKKLNLPFLNSKIGEVSCFSIELQNIIFEIKSRLELINEEIDTALSYFHMTFDASISNENYSTLVQKYIELQAYLITLVKKMDHCIEYRKKI